MKEPWEGFWEELWVCVVIILMVSLFVMLLMGGYKMKMEWQGRMELIEQEGGYASPQLYINGINITRTLWDRLGGGKELFKIEGKWKLTLERIEK